MDKIPKTTLKIKMTKTFKNKVLHLLEEFPRSEWSGVLFYDKKGTLLDTTITVTLLDVLLMDIGTSGSTEFEYEQDPSYTNMSMTYLGKSQGLIHSHHSLGVFFSGIDNKEIEDNVQFYPDGYLSIIVDSFGRVLGKYASTHTVLKTYSIFDRQKKVFREIEIEEEVLWFVTGSASLIPKIRIQEMAERIQFIQEKNKAAEEHKRIIREHIPKEFSRYYEEEEIEEEMYLPRTLTP